MRTHLLPDRDFLGIVYGANREVYPDGQHDRAY